MSCRISRSNPLLVRIWSSARSGPWNGEVQGFHRTAAGQRTIRKGQAAGDISTAVPLEGSGERSKVVPHPYQGQFALYDVREDAAEQFKCLNRLDASLISSKAAASKTFGKYYGAVFRLGRKDEAEQTVLATLWAREVNSWKLISYDVDPVWDEYRAPDTATAAAGGRAHSVCEGSLGTGRSKHKVSRNVVCETKCGFGVGLHLRTSVIDCVKMNTSCGSAAAEVCGGCPGAVEERDAERLEITGTVKRLDKAR